MKYVNIKEVGKMVKQNNGGNGHTMRIYMAWRTPLLLLSAALLILAGCPETPDNQSDTTAPEPVTLNTVSISATSSSITFEWTPSPSNDVAEIQATWTPAHGPAQPKVIDAGDTGATIEGLEAGTEYTFSVVVIDRSENESNAATFSFSTLPLDMRFVEESYTFRDIDITLGSSIGIVSATTEESGVTIAYSIVANNNSTPFAIDADTGEITVAGSGLNAENQYRLTVQATSSQGATATANVLIIPRDTVAPAPVTSLSAVPAGGTAVMLAWVNSISGDAAAVRIAWIATGSGDEGNAEILDGAETATITELESETEYTFTLTVVDNAGNVSMPEDIMATTVDITGPLPVTAPMVATNSGTAVTLTWTDSASDDAATVRIRWIADGSSDADNKEVADGLQTADITGLMSETRYTFTLTVVDDAGNVSSAPTAISVTTADITDPTEVSAQSATATSDTEVRLTWTDSADATMVHITWTNGGDTGVRVDRGTQEAIITGLTSKTEYTFTLVAEDAAGNRSTPVTADATTLDVTRPLPVTNLVAAITSGTTDVTLSWADSTSDDATTVRITWSETASGTQIDTRDVIHGTTSAVITGLTSEVSYTFTLVVLDDAVDTVGNPNPNESNPETETVTTSDINPPLPVQNLTAMPLVSGTEIELSWTNSGSADATTLDISWISTVADIASGDVSIPSGMDTGTYTIDGLTPNTPYTVTITVIDDVDNRSAPEAATPNPVMTLPNPIDTDGDGFVDINSLDRLNNMRHNLAGTSYKTGSSDGGILCGLDATIVCTGYELTQNLDFAESNNYDSGVINNVWRPAGGDPNTAINAGWDPIGSCVRTTTAACGGSGDTPFATVFEGNGYTISNLYIRNEGAVGLFGIINNNATIRSLGVVSHSVFGSGVSAVIGGLVGWNDGTVIASYATGSVVASTSSSAPNIGGLIGRNNGTTLASYATSSVDYQGNGGNDLIGGLIGRNTGTIIASYATGTATGGGNSSHVGGLVGWNTATITASYATGNVTGGSGGSNRVGGLVGENFGGTITATYATGSANGSSGGNSRVGSLVGSNTSNGTVAASYGFGSNINSGFTGLHDSGNRPNGVSGVGTGRNGARLLTAPGTAATTAVPTVWNQASSDSMSVWDFGTTMQAPALNYADYDGTDTTYGCGNASVADIVIPTTVPNGSGGITTVTCGSTLLAGPQPR